MARDSSWARRFIPRTCFTLGEVVIMLGVGRHQGRLVDDVDPAAVVRVAEEAARRLTEELYERCGALWFQRKLAGTVWLVKTTRRLPPVVRSAALSPRISEKSGFDCLPSTPAAGQQISSSPRSHAADIQWSVEPVGC